MMSASTRKVEIQVTEVSGVAELEKRTNSKMWYTIRAVSGVNTPVGKIKSPKIRSGNEFGSRHEMLIDTETVDFLVFELKYSRSILCRNTTVGSFTLSLTSSSKIDDFVPLMDKNGNVAGRIRICYSNTPSTSPSLRMSPKPFTKLNRSLRREIVTNLPNVSLCLQQTCGADMAFAVTSSWEPVVSAVASQKTEDSLQWKIGGVDTRQSRQLSVVLTSTNRNAGTDFSLSSQDGYPMYSLQRGNAFMSDSDTGMWTLLRTESKDSEEMKPVALINVAGPHIACCNEGEMPFALAIGNAMFTSISLCDVAWTKMFDDVTPILRESSSSDVRCAAGFFVAGSGFSCPLTLQMKLSANNISDCICECTYLRRALMRRDPVVSQPNALLAVGELGWSGDGLFGFL